MSQLLNLPTTDGNKFIVVDEGVDATYSVNLIIAWLQAIRKKGIEHPVYILLFSNPKYHLEKCLKSTNLTDIQVQDYFSTDVQDEEVDLFEQISHFVSQHINSIFVIDCLSTLALQIGVSKACKFVEKLYQKHRSQVFCIYRRDFHQNIPRMETLGNTYLKLKKSKKVAYDSNIHYEVSVIHKKPGGSISHWNELVKQNVETYSIETEKIPDSVTLKPEVNKPPEATVKPQASFRIEMNEHEMKQRDSVPLPYILPGNPGRESKIIYVPDDVDDLDEEDPDDDLDI
ncbi:hypothetical protein TSAR_001786 [Trichomalopsis sarcophagae]|uniref:Elongator complex protein 5 n=1 Tax=Trichomalopsis sarcophagae TaxID=543379 RepID=A0A232EW55_9HYME|nr:hypothetical protein TSAR_001786 [Trichomalopsis sarcophagae]